MLASRESTRSRILSAMFAQIQNPDEVRSIRISDETKALKNFYGEKVWSDLENFFVKN